MVAQWSITFRACELSCGRHPLYHIDIFESIMVAQWSITLTACELSCGPHPLYQIDTEELWLHNRQLRR